MLYCLFLPFVCLFGIIVFNFYPKFVDYLVSVSWALEQCWVWTASCGVGPNSNQTSLGYFHKLCVTISCLLGKTLLLIKGFIAGLMFILLLWQDIDSVTFCTRDKRM